MSEKKVFISGSISVKKLDEIVIKSFDNIILKNYKILVGDAPGIDTMVQNYLSKHSYTNTEIYSISSFPRYIANTNFKKKYIEVSNKIKKERERQIFKDKAMSDDCDFSSVIWDGKRKGSYANIIRAIESKKYVKVFYTKQNSFLEKEKITKQNIEYIYRENNGYSASEVVEYLLDNGIENFKKTQDLNKYLLEENVIKKEDKIYLPQKDYENMIMIESYKGKKSGIKFKNEFISWIEKKISSIPQQGELF